MLLNVVYLLLLMLAAPWLAWQALRTGKYRDGWSAKLWGLVPRRLSDRPCIWFHAVSVGEVNLIATLVRVVRERRPDIELVITTTTITGYALAQKKYPDAIVCYAPLDFTWAVRTAWQRIRPSMLVLAELELWPNLIAAAKSQLVPVAIVNGRLSEKSFRGYRRIRPWIERTLRQVDVIAVQNQEYRDRFVALGAEPAKVTITGSLKYDGAQTDRENTSTQRLSKLAGIMPGDIVFLAGSTQEPEEAFALAAYQSLSKEFPRLRLVIVPRHAERFDAVARQLEWSGVPWSRRSQLDGARPAERVLLIDTIGELGAWWGTAHIAFVGGSLSTRGGQNMIEPAAYGAAVSFGPNTQNFRDIVASLLACHAAVVVHDGVEMTAFVRRCLEDVSYREQLGRSAQRFVEQQLGATERTWGLLSPTFKPIVPTPHIPTSVDHACSSAPRCKAPR